jgi:hypothetical protein
MANAAASKIGAMGARFDAPEYNPDYDLNGDGVVDPYEVLLCGLIDINGDGKLDDDERVKLQAMLDQGDLAGVSFLQDRNGAGAKRSLTWWNSAEETRRQRRRQESAAATRSKAEAHKTSMDQHRNQAGMSSKLLEAMGMPLDALAKVGAPGTRAGDAEGAFTQESDLGPERRTMVGRHEPGLGYAEKPRFRSRQALMEWRRVERQPSGCFVNLRGDAGKTPEEALADHFSHAASLNAVRESDKQLADSIMSSVAFANDVHRIRRRSSTRLRSKAPWTRSADMPGHPSPVLSKPPVVPPRPSARRDDVAAAPLHRRPASASAHSQASSLRSGRSHPKEVLPPLGHPHSQRHQASRSSLTSFRPRATREERFKQRNSLFRTRLAASSRPSTAASTQRDISDSSSVASSLALIDCWPPM